jgi:hypothetical protein
MCGSTAEDGPRPRPWRQHSLYRVHAVARRWGSAETLMSWPSKGTLRVVALLSCVCSVSIVRYLSTARRTRQRYHPLACGPNAGSSMIVRSHARGADYGLPRNHTARTSSHPGVNYRQRRKKSLGRRPYTTRVGIFRRNGRACTLPQSSGWTRSMHVSCASKMGSLTNNNTFCRYQ